MKSRNMVFSALSEVWRMSVGGRFPQCSNSTGFSFERWLADISEAEPRERRHRGISEIRGRAMFAYLVAFNGCLVMKVEPTMRSIINQASLVVHRDRVLNGIVG